ncbi:mitogen-activated protein kinase kinase kinase 1-like [Canna indica]|uniref:mitogen-activated protein kinase kinase kinase n=1 Tax=Canna indica TaxID=4628 RepID=A0AAQ3QMU7_9LILI|nr:mitogen-activated protein kinase kinase kinase 1-like [Canna indica]
MLFFNYKKGASRSGRAGMDSRPRLLLPPSQQQQQQQQQRQGTGLRPKLERCNAVKNIDYEAPAVRASWSSGSSAASESSDLRATRSLDLYTHQKSFRIDGSVEGEVHILCRSLGLDGPEDFGIPLAEWEKRKVQSSSDLLPKLRLLQTDDATGEDTALASNSIPSEPVSAAGEEHRSQKSTEEEDRQLVRDSNSEIGVSESEPLELPCVSPRSGGGDGGIRGVRPPVLFPPPPMTSFSPPPSPTTIENTPSALKPPPPMSLPAIDGASSTWDILKSLAPDIIDLEAGTMKPLDSEDEEKEGVLPVDEVSEEKLRELWLGDTSEDFTGTSSYSTMNDDDSSSTTTETFIISPNGRFKRKIRSWMRGVHLGSGSFGMVYEGISDEGVFFAVKEVSLLDHGCNAPQCILQLEQEIVLLSQFEHENIVQYYGTDKEDSKLYIFLELVTQGSLASLYQKYNLRDSQVSAYTRQILNGLNYLHERNVVHRDIKCANLLVHANGSVKLADFGLAKEMTKFNMLKSCKGSVYWMAPEVINPRRTYGPAADIWSLGCTVLEMLTRQIPYPNLEWTQALFMIGRGEQPPIPDNLSRDARDFISKCVKVNPNDRPTASQLLEHPFVMRRSLRVSSGSNSSPFNNER